MLLYPYKDYKTFAGKLMGEVGSIKQRRCISRETSWIIQTTHGFTCIWEPYSLRRCNVWSGIAEVSTWRHTYCNLPDCGHGYHIVHHERTISSRLNKLEECNYKDRSIWMHAQGIRCSPALEMCTRFLKTQDQLSCTNLKAKQLWNW